MSLQVKIWLSVLLIALAGYTAFSATKMYSVMNGGNKGMGDTGASEAVAHPTGSLADEVLTDSAGKPFALDSLKGDVWLASFFFTSCPGPCAQMNRAIAGLQNEFTDPQLKFVSITCDPTNDTPDVLTSYARTFGADPKRWYFLYAPLEESQHLGFDVFKVTVAPQSHSEKVILVDKWSNVRGYYWTSDPSQMLALKRKISKLLAETGPPANVEPAEGEQDRNVLLKPKYTVEGAEQVDADTPEDKPAAEAPAESTGGDAASSEKPTPAEAPQ